MNASCDLNKKASAPSRFTPIAGCINAAAYSGDYVYRQPRRVPTSAVRFQQLLILVRGVLLLLPPLFLAEKACLPACARAVCAEGRAEGAGQHQQLRKLLEGSLRRVGINRIQQLAIGSGLRSKSLSAVRGSHARTRPREEGGLPSLLLLGI